MRQDASFSGFVLLFLAVLVTAAGLEGELGRPLAQDAGISMSPFSTLESTFTGGKPGLYGSFFSLSATYKMFCTPAADGSTLIYKLPEGELYNRFVNPRGETLGCVMQPNAHVVSITDYGEMFIFDGHGSVIWNTTVFDAGEKKRTGSAAQLSLLVDLSTNKYRTIAAVAGVDKIVNVLHLTPDNATNEFHMTFKSEIRCATVSRDSRQFFFSSSRLPYAFLVESKSMEIVRNANVGLVEPSRLSGHCDVNPLVNLACSSSLPNGVIYLWDTESLAITHVVDTGFETVNDCVMAPDGSFVVVGGSSGLAVYYLRDLNKTNEHEYKEPELITYYPPRDSRIAQRFLEATESFPWGAEKIGFNHSTAVVTNELGITRRAREYAVVTLELWDTAAVVFIDETGLIHHVALDVLATIIDHPAFLQQVYETFPTVTVGDLIRKTTIAHIAAASGAYGTLNLVLDMTAAPLAMTGDGYGMKPSHYLAYYGHSDLLVSLYYRLKMTNMLNLNQHDLLKRNVLHFAVMGGHANVASVALQMGVDPHFKDIDGRTPIDYAVSAQNEDLLRVLSADSLIR